jgi:hypothetical protein
MVYDLKILFFGCPMQRSGKFIILKLRRIRIETFIDKCFHDTIIIKFASIMKCSHSIIILNLWESLIVRNQHLCQVKMLIHNSIMKWSLIMAIRSNWTYVSFDENLKYFY